MGTFHVIVEPTNYYGFNKLVSNYNDAYDVLIGTIVGTALLTKMNHR